MDVLLVRSKVETRRGLNISRCSKYIYENNRDIPTSSGLGTRLRTPVGYSQSKIPWSVCS